MIYIKSLDNMVCAMVHASKARKASDPRKAAEHSAKAAEYLSAAVEAPDFKRGVTTMEVNLAKAFEQVEASRKRKVQAADDFELGDEDEDLEMAAADDEEDFDKAFAAKLQSMTRRRRG